MEQSTCSLISSGSEKSIEDLLGTARLFSVRADILRANGAIDTVNDAFGRIPVRAANFPPREDPVVRGIFLLDSCCYTSLADFLVCYQTRLSSWLDVSRRAALRISKPKGDPNIGCRFVASFGARNIRHCEN